LVVLPPSAGGVTTILTTVLEAAVLSTAVEEEHRVDSLREFLYQLPTIPWFEHIGEADNSMAKVRWLRTWHDWPGPEAPGVEAAAMRAQDLKHYLEEEANRRGVDIGSTWDTTESAARTHARNALPYDPEQDAWHAPTQSAWDAGWYAALVACHLQLELQVPIDLGRIWDLFKLGHWPCGYVTPLGEPGDGAGFARAELLVL
jgi:hypothetical protein